MDGGLCDKAHFGMDNITHGLAGLLLADLTIAAVERRGGEPVSPGFRRAAVFLGVIAAEFPDLDILYSGAVLGMGKIGYLLHHRGHTHTWAFALAAGLLLWGVTLWLRRRSGQPAERWPLLVIALGGTLSHVALDFTNSYGVHPFWPLDNAWYYGDAVFIIEPWIWVAVIPPLMFGARSAVGRAVLAAALGGILAAAWYVHMVENDVAFVLTAATVAWVLVMLKVSRARAVVLGAAAWALIEVTGFGVSAAARSAVHGATRGQTVLDVVLSPSAANPLCVSAIVVEVDGPEYVVGTATVAVLPRLRSATRCAGGDAALEASRAQVFGLRAGLQPSARVTTPAVAWRQEWTGPRDELVALAATHCEAAAALRFMRVPVWDVGADSVRLSDLRYGFGEGGFADVRFAARPAECPRFVPPWGMPRGDVVGGG